MPSMTREILVALLTTTLLSTSRQSTDGHVVVKNEKSFLWKVLSSEYVDKSLLVMVMLNDRHKVIVINRPFGSGKSLNLDMISAFLDGTAFRPLFAGGNFSWVLGNQSKTTVLEPLKITQHEDKMRCQGNYTVLRIRLQLADNEKDVGRMIMRQLKNIFSHEIDNSTEKSLNDSMKRERYINYGYNDTEDVAREDVVDSLRFASEILHNRRGKKVYILVEQYDWPFLINGDYEESSAKLQIVIRLFRDIYCRTFNNNDFVEKGILTGVLRLDDVHEEVFSHVDNLLENTILDEKFSEFYRFDESELELIKSPRRQIDEELSLKRWCCGYHFNSYVCNPKLVREYLRSPGFTRAPLMKDKTTEPVYGEYFLPKRLYAHSSYSVYPSATKSLLSLDVMQDDFRRLYMGEVLPYPVVGLVSNSVFHGVSNELTLIFYYGYLYPVTRADGNMIYMNVPNSDAKLWLYMRIYNWIKEKFNIGAYDLSKFITFLLDGHYDKFNSYWTSRVAEVEMETAIYNGLMILLWDAIHLLHCYKELRYETVFYMRNDTETVCAIVIPKPKTRWNNTAIVVEYGFADDLEHIAEAAVVCANRTDVEVLREKLISYGGIRKIRRIGLAFYKCNVSVIPVLEDIPVATTVSEVTLDSTLLKSSVQ